ASRTCAATPGSRATRTCATAAGCRPAAAGRCTTRPRSAAAGARSGTAAAAAERALGNGFSRHDRRALELRVAQVLTWHDEPRGELRGGECGKHGVPLSSFCTGCGPPSIGTKPARGEPWHLREACRRAQRCSG